MTTKPPSSVAHVVSETGERLTTLDPDAGHVTVTVHIPLE